MNIEWAPEFTRIQDHHFKKSSRLKGEIMAVWVRNLFTFLGDRNMRQLSPVLQDWEAMVRMHFLYAANEGGLIQALHKPSTKEELLTRLEVKSPEILEGLLALGLSCGEISTKDNLYFLSGKRVRALAGDNGDTVSALVQGNVTYYNAIFREVPDRMKDGSKGDYLDDIGEIIARYSKIVEPFLSGLVISKVKSHGSMRYLDIGCGSGFYLWKAVLENPQLTAVGIDQDPNVIENSKRNLEAWGNADRIDLIQGDIRTAPSELKGPFDLITFFNAVYYFSESERHSLFFKLKNLLSAGGELVIVSSLKTEKMDIGSANLNMVTSSINGCTPLPTVEEILSLLKESGYNRTGAERLLPGSSVYVIEAA